MPFQYSPVILPILISAILAAGVALYLWPRRRSPGATPLTLIAAVLAIWSAGYALEIAAVDLPNKIFWAKIQYIGIPFAPYLWLMFAVTYTSLSQQWAWQRLQWAALFPLTTFLLTATNERHQLIWTNTFVKELDTFSVLGTEHGLWFWVHFVVSYLWLLIGIGILLRGLWHTQGLYRSQILAMLVACFSPLVINLLFFAGLSPIPGLDLTPFAFLPTILALTWGIFGYRLADLTPIGRELVVDALREGILVVDEQKTIVDLNPAAGRLIGLPVSQAIGKPIAQVLAPWPHLVAHFQGKPAELIDELWVGHGESQRRYQLQVTNLVNTKQEIIGQLLTSSEIDPAGANFRPVNSPSTAPAAPPQLVVEEPHFSNPLLNSLSAFLIPPPQPTTEVLLGENPLLSQLLERAFTAMLRFGAIFGTLAVVVILPNMWDFLVTWVFIIGLAIIWVISLWRTLPFIYRVRTFLGLLYIFALNETLNYGYSVESFSFFLTLIALATLLQNRQAALATTFLSIGTLATIGRIMSNSYFLRWSFITPIASQPNYSLASLLVFTANAAMLVTAIRILLQSVNQAWAEETQAKNLLQQERDALDQRVMERTQEIRDSEINLRAFINSTPAIIIQTDQQGKILFLRIPGMDENNLSRALGQNFLNFVPESYHSTILTALEKVFNEQKSVQYESAGIDPRDGELHSYITNAAPIMDGEAVVSALLVNTDISERKEAEETLQKYVEELTRLTSEQKIILDNTAAAIFMQKEQKLVWGNPATHKLLGYTLAEMEQLPPAVYHPSPETFAQFAQLANDPLNPDKMFSMEKQLRRKDGTLIWCYVTGQLVNPGREADEGILWIMQDITPQKEAQQQSEQFLRDMKSLQQIHLSLSQIEEADELYQKMVEFSQHQLELDRVGLFLLDETSQVLMGSYGVDPEGQVRDERYYQETITENHWTQEVLSTPNHTKFWANAPLYDNNQIVGRGWKVASALWNGHKPLGYLVCDNLLTGRPTRPYQMELLSLLGSTFGHLIERKQEEDIVALARDQALEISRYKSMLLGKVSHELRTPLGAIIGYAELMQDEVVGPLEGEQKEFMGHIIDSARHLNGLITDLLDQAQIEQGSLQITPVPTNLTLMADFLRGVLKPLAHNKGLEFTLNCSAALPEVILCDEKRIRQIIINLTNNAIKFTEKGSVTVNIQPAGDDHWLIEVIDTGSGIAPEAQTKIFDTFWQVDRTAGSLHKGYGLGLSIVKQLVQRMQGDIQVASEVGQGSCFTVSLPLVVA